MSKRLILISLLTFLISACTQRASPVPPTSEKIQNTQPAPSNTMEPESTRDVSAAWTELALTKDAIVQPTVTGTDTAIASSTAAYVLCPGAPGPYAAVGNQVTVIAQDVDKLKLRSEPEISPNNILRELNRFTQMKIVGGPVCVHSGDASYWFWQVEVDRETGWIAEGDAQHTFIAVAVGSVYAGFTAMAQTATTAIACQRPHGPMGVGVEVIVMARDSDKLKLRSEPRIAPDTVLRELDPSTRLEIVGGPVCVTSEETGISYWLWKVKVISGGKIGWVAEGDGQNEFLDPIMPP